MHNIYGDNIDTLYVACLNKILTYGHLTHPRSFDCKELSPCSVTLTDIQNNILVNPVRKASQAFMAAELLWILMGRDDVDMISFYNSKIQEYSDDSVRFFGAYGPKVHAQLPYIIQTLLKDPWSRQAVLNIWRENPPITKDVPCTVTMHFVRRPIDTLNLIVYMRSQDVWLGFPYDVHNFTCVQLIVAGILGCKPGKFTLVQGSLHMYYQDFEKARKAMAWPGDNMCRHRTPLSNIEHSEWLLNKQLPRDEENYRKNVAAGPYLYGCPLINQKMDWLYDFCRRKHELSSHK